MEGSDVHTSFAHVASPGPTADGGSRGRGVAGAGAARLLLPLAVALLLAVAAPPHARAAEQVFDRGVADACTDLAQSLRTFPDVADGGTHAGAIDCLAHWGIVRGRPGPGDPVYAPADAVDRAAMASYLVQALKRLPAVTVPGPSTDRFPDYEAGTHADNVHVLRAAGVVAGREDGTYAPRAPVTRAQMASYIARTLEFVTDDELPIEQAGVFPDSDGVHRSNIDKLATIGGVTGRPDGTYGPGEPVTRAQMASFVARALDYLAFRGYLPVAFDIAIGPSAEQVPYNLNQRIAGTVDDQFGRGYFSAEVRFEVYRDGDLVLTSNTTSGLGGDVDLRYNAGAAEGDTDEVVACIVDADETTSDEVPFCLDTDLEPIEDRRATRVTFAWDEPAVASTTPDQGRFFGMAINLNADDNILGYQTLPEPPLPADAPIGDFLFVEYVNEANFIVNGRTNVTEAEFECAVQTSIDDERNGHLLDIHVGPDTWNSYALSTSSEVTTCSP